VSENGTRRRRSEPEYIRVSEVMDITELSRDKVYEFIAAGIFVAVKDPGGRTSRWRITRKSFRKAYPIGI